MQEEFDPAALLKNELAAQLLRSVGELRLRVTGSSMLPAVRPGDVLTVRRCAIDEATRGDIILFTRGRRLFAHRVVACPEGGLVTQGDGIPLPDSPVGPAEFLGKVIHVRRRGSPVYDHSRRTLAGRISAALVRRSTHAGRLLTRFRYFPGRTGQ